MFSKNENIERIKFACHSLRFARSAFAANIVEPRANKTKNEVSNLAEK